MTAHAGQAMNHTSWATSPHAHVRVEVGWPVHTCHHNTNAGTEKSRTATRWPRTTRRARATGATRSDCLDRRRRRGPLTGSDSGRGNVIESSTTATGAAGSSTVGSSTVGSSTVGSSTVGSSTVGSSTVNSRFARSSSAASGEEEAGSTSTSLGGPETRPMSLSVTPTGAKAAARGRAAVRARAAGSVRQRRHSATAGGTSTRSHGSASAIFGDRPVGFGEADARGA